MKRFSALLITVCVSIPPLSAWLDTPVAAGKPERAEPCCTLNCGPTRALGARKPGKRVPLAQGFRDPPPISRVQCWWQCHGSAFTKKEITRQLEGLKANGFGGVTVKDTTSMPRDRQTADIVDIDYMSPNWLDMFAHIVKECGRLELICRTRLGSGWNAGGPWVTRELASQVMAFSVSKPISGPTRVSVVIPTTTDGAPSLAALHGGEAFVLGICQSDKHVVNLTDKVDSARQLSWNTPEGTWVLASCFSRPSTHPVRSCSTSGAGRHHDHCSEAGTDLQLRNVAQPILTQLGPFERTAFDGLNLDSWELGKPTWTPGFLQTFVKRRGYDPVLYLPVLMQISDKLLRDARFRTKLSDLERRFLFDLRTTISERIIETHYARIAGWCRRHGVVLEAQAGGPNCIPNEPLRSLGAVDIPMGEFWMNGWSCVRVAASAAHTYGHRLVGLESFTDTSGFFQTSPARMKPRADEAFLLGGNYLNIAVTDYSPKEAGIPGWIHAAGPHINQCQTWWPLARPVFDYLARCCFLLQSGHNVAQVAYYRSLRTPSGLFQKPGNKDTLTAAVPKTFAFDLVNDDLLQNHMRVAQHQIVLTSGAKYSVLYVEAPESRIMPLATVDRIHELLCEGATVVWSGPRPTKCPTLAGYPERDGQLQAVSEKLFAHARLITLASPDLAQLVPIVEQSARPAAWKTIGDAPIRFVHRSTPEAEMFFVVNRSTRAVDVPVFFRVVGRSPESWNPETGAITRIPFERTPEGIRVQMNMSALGSTFVVFRESDDETVPVPRQIESAGTIDIPGPWQLEFPAGLGAPAMVGVQRLQSWTEFDQPGIRAFSGIATYRTTFIVAEDVTQRRTNATLDLGRVLDVCDVWLNGHRIGIGWHSPFRFDVSDVLQPGKNELVVHVANTWINRVQADSQLPPAQRITRIAPPSWYQRTRNRKPVESGLIGPVLVRLKRH